jgi:coenzyme F420-reducing hydrogenase beta subunit
MENPKFNFQPRILASNKEDIRYKGSSGGIITHLIKYLFETNKINSAIGFKFTVIELFKPYLINSFDEYEQTGSIYHEVNIYKFLNENIEEIKSPIMITCLPCQIIPIKRLMNNHKIETVIISLVCSSQLEKEATYYFLEKNNIDISKVKEFRYRGNGWPSGIQIKTDEKEYFFHNNNSKWIDVFHSQIFSLKRCLSCKDTFGLEADISIADPWLKRYVEKEKIGSSIVIPHTDIGENIIISMIDNADLEVIEILSQEDGVLSQKGTLIKKYILKKYKKRFLKLIKIFRSEFYKKYFFNFSKYHRYFFSKLISIIQRYKGLK